MSRASTQLLDDMHYRGMLRIAGRIGGVRTYAVRHAPEPALVVASPETAMDALVGTSSCGTMRLCRSVRWVNY